MAWDTVIGLEVHAQLQTRSKLFSGARTSYGATPNSNVSYIDAGLPGVLPVLNQEAVRMAIQFGLSIDATINNLSYFERKNYFYPDLPKGYQISQYLCPIVSHGFLNIELPSSEIKKVEIIRAHLEEDAGKSLHDAHADYTGIDLNRAGTPLLEIVTAPCLYRAEEVIHYLKDLQQLLRFLGICDGNMQEGSFRCDVNISLKPAGSKTLGTRTELKNLNSFRFIEKAIAYEQLRHQELLESGQPIYQETRLFCPITETTQVLRSKEMEQDYRYFPDPDLLPIEIENHFLETIKKNMPTLPQALKHQLKTTTTLQEEDIHFLLASPLNWQFYNEVKKHTQIDEKIICNWLKGTYSAALHESKLSFEKAPISAVTLATLLNNIHNKTISNTIARQIFSQLMAGEGCIEDLLKKEEASEINDNDLLIPLIQSLTHQYPQQAEEYRQGKEKLLAFFVGLVMKETKGKANPEQVNALLKKYLQTP